MFAKILSLTGLLALATVLSTGGFCAYLVGTGKVNASRLETIAAVLRGELDEPPDEPEVEPTVVAEELETEGVRSAEEAQAQRRREHLQKLAVERALADLEAQRRLLDHALHRVIQEQEQLADTQQEFESQRQAAAGESLDEGFQRELEIVSTLKPAQAKEHVLRVWRQQPADAVRLLIGMDDRQVRRILEQLKTAEELDIQTELLEQIRTNQIQGRAPESGTTDGDASS